LAIRSPRGGGFRGRQDVSLSGLNVGRNTIFAREADSIKRGLPAVKVPATYQMNTNLGLSETRSRRVRTCILGTSQHLTVVNKMFVDIGSTPISSEISVSSCEKKNRVCVHVNSCQSCLRNQSLRSRNLQTHVDKQTRSRSLQIDSLHIH